MAGTAGGASIGSFVTSDNNLLPIYKYYYRDKPVESLFNRMSPVLKAIKWTRIGGKFYNFAAQVGRGGGIASDFNVAVNNAANMARNVEFSVAPGKLFACFNTNQLEIYGSENGDMAYVKAAVDKLHATVEGVRQALAAAFYASGWGECGVLKAAAATSSYNISVGYDTGIKLDIYDYIDVLVSPTSTLVPIPMATIANGGGSWDLGPSNGGYQISAIANSGTGYTVTLTAYPGADWPIGSIVCRHGSGASSSQSASLLGLAAWLPSWNSRGTNGVGSASTYWASYIGTAFATVTRNANTDKLAGQWYGAQGTYGTGTYPYTGGSSYDRYIDALTVGIRLARRGGCANEDILIAINDEDFYRVSAELLASTTYMQMVNTGDKTKKTHVQRGVESFDIDFSTSGTRNIFDDPYCPKNTAYVLDKDCVEFVVLSNPQSARANGVAENEPGVEPVEATGDFDKAFKLIIDDFLFNAPITNSPDGPAMLTAIGIYGNFVVHNPAHCCVVTFGLASS